MPSLFTDGCHFPLKVYSPHAFGNFFLIRLSFQGEKNFISLLLYFLVALRFFLFDGVIHVRKKVTMIYRAFVYALGISILINARFL